MSVQFTPIPLEEEYSKKTGITPADISKLRKWLKTQPHLPGDHITDLDLILTYHCCGRSSEVAKQLLDLHFTIRTLFTSFFKDRFYDDRMKFVVEKVILFTSLEARTSEGYGVFFTHFLERDAKHFVLCDVYRAGIMCLDLFQNEEGTHPGFMMVLDLDGMNLGHLAKIDIHSLQQFLYYLQEGLLVNMKGLHFLNAPSFMDRLMMLLRPFLNKALMSVLHIHQTSSNTLEPFFAMEHLPKGVAGRGNGRSLEECRSITAQKMEAGKQFFVEENKKRVVEALRPGRPKTITDIFGGVEGSFKKLDID